MASSCNLIVSNARITGSYLVGEPLQNPLVDPILGALVCVYSSSLTCPCTLTEYYCYFIIKMISSNLNDTYVCARSDHSHLTTNQMVAACMHYPNV